MMKEVAAIFAALVIGFINVTEWQKNINKENVRHPNISGAFFMQKRK